MRWKGNMVLGRRPVPLRDEYSDAQIVEHIASAEKYIEQLEYALRNVVRDVNDYEQANKLHPNPGRTECWDSVASAKKLLLQKSF